MKEIHRIREKLYEEARGMTIEGQTRLSRARVDAFLKERGIKLRTVEKTAK